MGTAVVEARDLRKRYGHVAAVDGVSFAVEAGEFFGIPGPNGAGKTTTLETSGCSAGTTSSERRGVVRTEAHLGAARHRDAASGERSEPSK